MKTLILRTFRQTKAWEFGKTSCQYDNTQLKDMILVWQENYLELKASEIDYALGIYTEKYFEKSSIGNLHYMGTPNEQTMSIIKPIAFDDSDSFQIVTRLDNEKIQTTLLFQVLGKLWINSNRDKMLNIDKELTQAKMSELIKRRHVAGTKFHFPLSFVLDSDVVKSILSNNNCNL
ncbi:MAG: hypothetical protein HN528_12435 [Candidatus Marinimicrobia bacterium]|nr:hypothetical protein [Candidatus Neomarinimicrobiota bacterium]